jgi:hypothetical protein
MLVRLACELKNILSAERFFGRVDINERVIEHEAVRAVFRQRKVGLPDDEAVSPATAQNTRGVAYHIAN